MGQQKVNYQKELEQTLDRLQKENRVPSLLLHSCCAPCSSYVLEYLSQYFKITVFYYNPNIYPEREYFKRVQEQQYLIGEMKFLHPVIFLEGTYDKDKFYKMAEGMEQLREGGERCFRCYEMRLRKTAEKAMEGSFDYFTTTLSISPMKNAQKLNEIGCAVGREFGVEYLTSDFKKKNGYKRSVELSGEYGLYRQDYCGCEFSKEQREREQREREKRTGHCKDVVIN